MKLTAEQLGENYQKLIDIINEYIAPGPRQDALLKLYDDLANRIALAPASTKMSFHNAFPGGYVLHVLNVVSCALKQHKLWEYCGADMVGYTKEELVFAALNHDLGKIGDLENDQYIPQDNQWYVTNRGEIYKYNPEIDNMPHQYRAIYLLQHYGVKMTVQEMIAIEAHEGLFEDGNKTYYIQYDEDKKFKTNLPIIIHFADYMAARIEFEAYMKTKKGKNINSDNYLEQKSQKTLSAKQEISTMFDKEK